MNPLAVVAYKRLMPGSQLVNRLQDLNYRVQPVSELSELSSLAATEGPMLILVDLDFEGADACASIAGLRNDPATAHIPIIAFTADSASAQGESARKAGATLVTSTLGIQNQLPELLEAALKVD